MKTYRNPAPAAWSRICRRPAADDDGPATVAAEVFAAVRRRGDKALLEYTRRFDGVRLNDLAADTDELERAARQVPPALRRAIDVACANIRAFHRAQTAALERIEVETMPGVRCWREARPIGSVGLYVPGGSAPLFSTVLMLGVPAQLAGCREIVLCTPPQADGSLDPAICYAAGLAGIGRVFKVGGAQAVAALACGTASIPKVDKIFGPGNRYVTAAKQYAARYGAAVDMPAGPSEVMVVADGSARPDFAAADLLSQAEHGPDSQVVLVATSEAVASAVKRELKRQLRGLPRRDVAARALDGSRCVIFDNAALADNVARALDFANAYAPEHLILSVRRPAAAARKVQNAGSVFLGNYSPESAGDYASGTNHTLPTDGWTRACSGLSLESFCKYVTFQSITPAGARRLGPAVAAMADAEGLDAHRRAMEIRL